jgi:hypothetical protein
MLQLPLNDSNPLELDSLKLQKKPQHYLSALIHENALKRFTSHIQRSTTRDQTRFNSVSQGHSALLFTAIPSIFNKQLLSPREFQIKIRLHLGMTQYALTTESEKCEACKAQNMDQHGDHAMNCTKDTGLGYRHKNIVSVLFDLIKESNIMAQKEYSPPGSNSQLVPGDIFLPSGIDWDSLKTGSPTYIDVTVVNPTSKSNVRQGRNEPNRYLNERAMEKFSKYYPTFQQDDAYKFSVFRPFAMDVYGTLHLKAEEFLQQLAKIGAQFHNTPVQKRLNHCRLKIQFSLAKCVSAQIQTKTPSFFHSLNHSKTLMNDALIQLLLVGK